jgi:hypothetical protein
MAMMAVLAIVVGLYLWLGIGIRVVAATGHAPPVWAAVFLALTWPMAFVIDEFRPIAVRAIVEREAWL